MSRYKEGESVGDGFGFFPKGKTAWRLKGGDVEEISLEEARKAVEERGLPLPDGFIAKAEETGVLV